MILLRETKKRKNTTVVWEPQKSQKFKFARLEILKIKFTHLESLKNKICTLGNYQKFKLRACKVSKIKIGHSERLKI